MRDVVTLREAMTRSFVGVNESDTVSETAALLASEGAEDALVLRGGDPVGRVRASDLLGVLAGEGDAGAAVRTVMSDPPPTLPPEASVEEAALALSGEHDWRAVVSDGDGALGTVDARDVLAAGAGRSAPAPDEPDVEADPAESDEFAEQSICEGCGTLSRSLARSNGRLLCAACREV
jgi:CBS domain-containing protein